MSCRRNSIRKSVISKRRVKNL